MLELPSIWREISKSLVIPHMITIPLNVIKAMYIEVWTYIKLRCFEGINPLTPNDPYMGHTAPPIYKRCILYIYSTNSYAPLWSSMTGNEAEVTFNLYCAQCSQTHPSLTVLSLKQSHNSPIFGSFLKLTVWRLTTHIWVVPHR